MSRDWIVMNFNTGCFECRRCGDTYRPKLPCLLTVYCAMAKAYAKVHGRCKERKTA